MKNSKRSLWSVLGLIISVSAILAYVSANDSKMVKQVAAKMAVPGPVSVRGDLVQDKILSGSDGKLSVSLTLTASEVEPTASQPIQHADLVIVLDRSGSMKGQKIKDARQAVLRLIDGLTAKDRLALVTYSNGVHIPFPLLPMDEKHRRQVKGAVRRITSAGGTNLGGGLSQGIQTLLQTPSKERQRKVILISDGLANHGVTDPNALGSMASDAVEHNFSVSTVGVGYDFNEVLMTTIADHGAGRYYFLENPNAFAQVFEKELQSTRNVAAASLELRIPLADGVKLIHAGGYPIGYKDDHAVIHPGDLLSGQERKLFLTYLIPTGEERDFDLGVFKVDYTSNGVSRHVVGNSGLILACVADQREVVASIDQAQWADQVIKEDYNQLKEEVATAIRKGQKKAALVKIQEYEDHKRTVNAGVGSAKVSENLKSDLPNLRQSVEETFAGAPAAVAEKKKQRSKALQYEAYQIRRDKK